MKKQNPCWKISVCFVAACLTLLGGMSAVQAAAPALQGSLTLRPLTFTEISKYNLTNPPAQFCGGLNTVGLGEPVYLDAMVNAAIAPSNIVGVTWSLVSSNKPAGSSASLSSGPLGNNVPLFNTSDRYTGENSTPAYQLAGRTFFRPDVIGTYTVKATITTVGSGSTNLSVTVTAATYLGLQTCAACHSGGTVINGVTVPSIYPTYTNTPHASFFTKAIDGLESSHYSKNCIQCHTVGYDTNSFAVNGGFDDIALLYGWTFPAVLTNNPSNWAAMPAALQNLANIQCENCHGPGSQHFSSQGIVGNTNAISVNYAAGDCSQCHDDLNNHYYSAEWNNSLHAAASRTPSGISRPQCVRCHTAPGFVGWATAGGMALQNQYPTNIIWGNYTSTNIVAYNASSPTYTTPQTPPTTTYYPITCQACHDPHDFSNPHQLRMGYNVTLSDGTVVTNAGAGGFCMECHNSRNGSVTNMLAKYPLNQPNWAGGVSFGTHDSPQGDMLEGINAVTYGQMIPSAPHALVVSNTCVGCHMQTIASTDPAFTLAGGHSTKMSYTNSAGVYVPVTYVCTQCHGKVTNFDILAPDYVGVGYSLGIQTQVQMLLNKLSTLLPNSTYQANPNNYVADGLVKTPSSQTNWPTKFLQAAYNWQFVSNDGSLGVHNGPFAVGLLKASIGNLTGDANGDGLPDSWQTTYFGANFATNSAAGPNGINNVNGLPNWMMYSLGLSPFSSSTAVNGVIYVNGKNIVNGATNTVAIYTAAEIAFNTQVGTTYTIQGITALTGNWSNISTNIPGTGGSVSYLTPTRNSAQMFFRVVHTP
jgi:nitrate reductase cytochrome c-type subunit